MKVLEIVPSLGTGGGEKFVVDLSNEFYNLGHEVSVVTLYDLTEDDILKRYVQPGVLVSSLAKIPGADIRCMFKVFRYIRKNRPNVVHVHLGAIMYVLISAIFYRKTKYYATIHSEARREAGSGLSKWIRLFLFKLRLVHPVTISIESDKSFTNFYNISGFLIPNGSSEFIVDDSVRYNFSKYHKDVDFLFLHAGRIHGVKNQLMLVKAFNLLIDKGVKARLLIAGRIDDERVYDELRPYFSDKIVYIGEQSDIKSIMASCDAFCLSSSMEGMPITIIEAFSVGCVPIVTPVGGCLNMITNGVNGFIAESVDVNAYFDSLYEFTRIEKETLDRIKSEITKTFHENYSISQSAKKYIDLFQF